MTVPAISELDLPDDELLRRIVGELRGEAYERRCAELIDAVLIDHFDFAVLADRTSINRQLIQARHGGLITREEYEGGRNVDIIAQEQTEDDTPTRFAAVEVSVTFNEDDLRNAAGRAGEIWLSPPAAAGDHGAGDAVGDGTAFRAVPQDKQGVDNETD